MRTQMSLKYFFNIGSTTAIPINKPMPHDTTNMADIVVPDKSMSDSN